MDKDAILILDFGGNQAYYTARRMRGEQFYCEILPGNTDPETIMAMSPKGIVLVGGECAELHAPALPFEPDVFGVPVLALGGAARMLATSIKAEYTGIQMENNKDFVQFSVCDLFEELSENDRYFERVDGFTLPEGYISIASTQNGLMPCFANLEKHIYGLQFYVESNDPDGFKILENFAGGICGCTKNWTVENFAPVLIERIREEVGDSNVLISISGGVDSAVTAALLSRAIGNRLVCLFVDNGLLRKGDPEMVRRIFRDDMKLELVEVDARERFVNALRGVSDPEEKRDILYDEFSSVLAEQYVKVGSVEFMAEGTIYPDVLSGKPRLGHKMIEGCRAIEPIRQLFKEEVRALGRYLNLSEEIVTRPSFASPGLAIRCLGEVTQERLHVLREADLIFRQEIEKAGLSRKIAQFFVILTDLKTPGLRGDGYVCVLRAMGSSNAGNAPAYRLPYDLMDAVVRRITGEVPGVNHVVYDITARPIASVEWE